MPNDLPGSSAARRRYIILPVMALLLYSVAALAQNAPPQSDTPTTTAPNTHKPLPQSRTNPTGSRGTGRGSTTGVSSTTVPSSQRPPNREGHPAETNPGSNPHSSSEGPIIAGATIGAGLIIGELVEHYNASPEKLLHDGPQVPKEFDMNGFAIKGLVHPSWPIVVDFMLDSPGAVRVDLTAADKHHYEVLLKGSPNHRAFAIFRLPPDFGSKLQTAVFRVNSVPAAGATTAPMLRTYGLGAGEKAVGSVAIDQLTFTPPTIHPKAKEFADFGFHAHSAFDGVRAEFIFTTFYNGHLLAQKDQEEKLSPIPEGERARGTWEGKGKPGEHMLQIRAWRGLENGGDWVVAWSPDIVDVVK